MDTQRAAELQAVLEGVALPASRQELVDYVRRQEGGERFRGELEALPDHEYRSIDEVGEELVHVQPSSPVERSVVPREESGEPPGGDAYVDPGAESGAVRPDWPEDHPPQKVLEQQSALLKKQQQQ